MKELLSAAFSMSGLIVLALVGVGCRPTANSRQAAPQATATVEASAPPLVAAPISKAVKEPGDARLTLALVLRRPAAFTGKRVRWFGRLAASESTGKDSSYKVSAVFVNNSETDAAEDFRYFAVEYQANDSFPYERAWINGTVRGTKRVSAVLTDTRGNQRSVSRLVPRLIDPEFEPIAEKEN